MAGEQTNAAKNKPAGLVVVGLLLVTVGALNHGLLQIVLLLAAVGLLGYAVVLTRKNTPAKSNDPGNTKKAG